MGKGCTADSEKDLQRTTLCSMIPSIAVFHFKVVTYVQEPSLLAAEV